MCAHTLVCILQVCSFTKMADNLSPIGRKSTKNRMYRRNEPRWVSIVWKSSGLFLRTHHQWHYMLNMVSVYCMKSPGLFQRNTSLVALNAEIQRCIPYLFYMCVFKEKKMLGKTFQPFVKLHLNLLLLLFFQSTIWLSSFLFLWEETSKQCWEASTAAEVVNIHSITWDTPLTPSQ